MPASPIEPVLLSLPVANAAQVAKVYDRLIVYRSPTGAGGPFTEITSQATRPALSPTVNAYTYLDQTGSRSAWYATAFFASLSGQVSPMGPPIPASGDPALSVLSVAALKARSFQGLLDGIDLPDSFWEGWIRGAVDYVEANTDLTLTPTSIVDEKHAYFRPNAGTRPVVVQTFKGPFQALGEVRFTLPYAGVPRVIPANYLTAGSPFGQITIYPGFGSVLFNISATYALISPGLLSDCLPEAIGVDYTAGFPPGKVPASIVDCVLMAASLGPLGVLGDQILGPGYASESTGGDGFSESVSSQGGYQARMQGYQQMLADRLALARMRYRGVSLVGG